jgi:hypothetical protein
MMARGFRQLMLTVHVTASVGWLGAIVAYVALNVPALASGDEQLIRAAYLMMEVVLRYALIPLAAVSLTTGIAQALGTPWGLFRHYWVTISLALTAFAFVILVLHVPAVEDMAAVAANPRADVTRLDGDLFHSEHLQAPRADALRMAPHTGTPQDGFAHVTHGSPGRPQP